MLRAPIRAAGLRSIRPPDARARGAAGRVAAPGDHRERTDASRCGRRSARCANWKLWACTPRWTTSGPVSSLSLLKRHPLAAIKIDRSFVTGLADDPRDRAIVAAVTNMAHALGFVVTAEGVETESQLESVRELGCDRAQGFLLARPMPQDELLRLLGAERV